jgi:TetR/AcrR family transcriptional repressor of nem operon
MIQKSPRAGRPLKFEPDAVLDAAMRLFWARGFERTSLDDLEARTGLSRSSLYNTFDSKHELFLGALGRYLRMLDDYLLAPLESGNEGLVDIDRFFSRLGTQLDDPTFIAGCLLTNSLAEFGGQDDEVVRHGQLYLDRARRAIRTALARAASLGEIEASTADLKSDLLLGLVLAINLVARSGLGVGRFTALLEAVHAQIDGWRLNGAGATARATPAPTS